MKFWMAWIGLGLMAAAAQAEDASEAEILTSDGVALHVWSVPGEAPAVVAPMRGWHEPFRDHFPAGQAFVFYDPRSRGRSGVAPDSTLEFETDLGDLEAVRGGLELGRIHVMGASYYGGLAAAYAARWPEHVASVIMVGPISLTQAELFSYAPPHRATRAAPEDVTRLEELRAAGGEETDPVGFCRAYRRTVDPTIIHDLRQLDRVPDPCLWANEWPANFSRWATAIFADLGEWDFTSIAAGVQAPVLVIQGQEDLIVPPESAERWVRLLPHARLLPVPAAGHVLWYEKPATFFSDVAGFLTGEWPATAVEVGSR